jgi:hypothetical protein
MCLKTEQRKPQIATEDIICYKIINKDMTSLFHSEFKWELGKLYKTKMEWDFNTIGQAFHSFASLEGLKKAYYVTTQPCIMVKCTIPKTSLFYSGEHDYIEGYASNRLIINEVIDTKELYPDFDWDNYPYKEGQMIRCKMSHNKNWHDIIYSGEQVKSHDDIWEDCQIMNIQPHPTDNTRIDLIVKDCSDLNYEYIIKTIFNGEFWESKNCFLC